MIALILNSGLGKRMGHLTSKYPKCMSNIGEEETILSRQLKQVQSLGIKKVVITTGLFDEVLVDYCKSLSLDIEYKFVNNSRYAETNYIYSIHCAKEFIQDEDILLLHGDLVFEDTVIETIINSEKSCMVVSSTKELPQKDFKAVLDNGKITSVGIEFFDNAITAQPMYYIKKEDWNVWLSKIGEYCESGNTNCYAENAFNEVSDKCNIYPYDVKNMLCQEIDTEEDLNIVVNKINEIKNRTVYMCFSTDIVHSGHIAIIKKAAKLGKLTVGVLSDEAVISFKRFPLLPFEERKVLFENISDVYSVIKQDTLSYANVINELKPDFIVHGDDWNTGFQKPIRDEVVKLISAYGGQLVEFPYTNDIKFNLLEKRAIEELSIPDIRRGRLKKAIDMKGCISAIEAHSGLTGLIAEKTVVHSDGKSYQFDAMWVSSLCDSVAKGKPDIELVDMTSRFRTIDDIMEVTTKPIIFDGDTGGLTEHFIYTVRTLERMGVSAVIIEDKCGLKKNSLFGTEVEQVQDTIENFCAKISAGKRAQKTSGFMIIARIESLILERGMDDALERAFAYVDAGADGIMIHSRRKEPDEIFEFVAKFREREKSIPVVVVPTSFNTVTEEEFKERGVNIVIYANQLTRSAYPAMKKTAETILINHRAKEADDACIPFKEIISLIPEEF